MHSSWYDFAFMWIQLSALLLRQSWNTTFSQADQRLRGKIKYAKKQSMNLETTLRKKMRLRLLLFLMLRMKAVAKNLVRFCRSSIREVICRKRNHHLIHQDSHHHHLKFSRQGNHHLRPRESIRKCICRKILRHLTNQNHQHHLQLDVIHLRFQILPRRQYPTMRMTQGSIIELVINMMAQGKAQGNSRKKVMKAKGKIKRTVAMVVAV
mmetsp:Transcript_7575/g.9954  ORF Transcript_7575/g.9954 Transcript_7575/m.9954 type:complete len:209 (+) Transcript_7575:129-755(+)